MFRRKKPQEWARYYDELAVFNSEVARGIVHTNEWRERMATKQSFWDLEHHGPYSSTDPNERALRAGPGRK